MIYNTKIQIITSNSDWTSFRYVDFDGIVSKDSTAKIKKYLKNNQLDIDNADKLA